jgi:hypothetical protein
MGSDLGDQLRKIFPSQAPPTPSVATPSPLEKLLYGSGRKSYPYNHLSITKTFVRFKAEFLSICPLHDPLDRNIRVETTNFKKLLNLKHKALGDRHRAYMLVDELESGTFNPTHYLDVDLDRIRTLFWVPNTILDPDVVYPNSHATVQADEVFITVYEKQGARIKLTFTARFGAKCNPRFEIVTSYLTNARGALKCVRGKPMYTKT